MKPLLFLRSRKSINFYRILMYPEERPLPLFLPGRLDGFDKDDFRKKSAAFGTIVLESNREMDLKTAYDCYDSRWLIELVFRYYKNPLDLHRLDARNRSTNTRHSAEGTGLPHSKHDCATGKNSKLNQ